MKVTWLAHASFLIEGGGLRIITDPYEPNEIMNLPPIEEAADLVIRSSDDDEAHCYVETIPAGFDLVTATEIVETGAEARGVKVEGIWSQESLIHKEVVRDNAMYRFTIDGIHITHMGDTGNPLSTEQMEALAGTDLLFALAGGPPTIELADLVDVIRSVKPRVVIPMHYRIPGPRFHMLPVDEFLSHFSDDMIERVGSTTVEFSKESLPEQTRIFVLEPSHFRNER